jgi:hypothetical protein
MGVLTVEGVRVSQGLDVGEVDGAGAVAMELGEELRVLVVRAYEGVDQLYLLIPARWSVVVVWMDAFSVTYHASQSSTWAPMWWRLLDTRSLGSSRAREAISIPSSRPWWRPRFSAPCSALTIMFSGEFSHG